MFKLEGTMDTKSNCRKKTEFLILGIFSMLFIIILTSYLFRNGAEKNEIKMDWSHTAAFTRNNDSIPVKNTDVVLQYDTLAGQKSATYNKYINNNINSGIVKVESKVNHNRPQTTKVLPLTQTKAREIKTSKEVTHIEFLKVHKAASSTVQSIFLRFGLDRNLSFVIPTPTHYISTQKYFFSDIWPSLHAASDVRGDLCENINSKYDMLTHHMVFNSRKVSQLLHSDSVYVAIVRDPFDTFVAAARYYKFAIQPYGYLDKLSNETFIIDLIRNPKQCEATIISESMTYNSMSYDFGLECLNAREPEKCTDEKFTTFLNETRDTFSIVMVFERFDESLVLLRRHLNWSMKDLFYAKINTFSSNQYNNYSHGFNITADDMVLFKERNRFDYGLYKLFKDRLQEQISNEKDFDEEVKQFRLILSQVRQFCLRSENTGISLTGDDSNHLDSVEISKSDNILNVKNIELLKSIKTIFKTKVVSRRQEGELLEIFDSIESGGKTETTIVPLAMLLPLLFEDKVNGSESKLFIYKSKWNESFYVTTHDCILMSMDIMSLYEVVKHNHLKILIEHKFGNSFSLHEAVQFLSTFT